MKALLENKTIRSCVLCIGIATIFIGIGAVAWNVAFPVDIEQKEIAERVKELQKQRAKWIKNKCQK